ncbi:MAG: metal ABC transporter substrate-binding protein [Negativicutes bacterium]
MKKHLILILLIICLCGCGTEYRQVPFIATTIYPLTDITQRICGEKMQVRQVIPPQIEPHEWDPSPSALKDINAAAFLVAIGPMLEPTAKLSIDSDKQLFMCNFAVVENYGAATDPHMWLNPQNFIRFIPQIVNKLCSIDAVNAEYYQQNSAKLIVELSELDKIYNEKLSHLKNKEFVVTHAAFGYLANRYNLTQHSILGNTPEEEPSAKHLNKLAEFCKSHKISTIYFEPRESEKLATRFAGEINAKVLPLDPLEMAPLADNKAQGYVAIMRLNLEQLINGNN